MPVATSEEYREAAEHMALIPCPACGYRKGWDITFDIVQQFKIYDDGEVIDGERYLGEDAKWSAVCPDCGHALDLRPEDEQALTTLSLDVV